MKKIVAHIYYALKAYYSVARFKRSFVSLSKNDKLLVVDIDNTLADSWITLKYNTYTSEKERIESLPIFVQMRSLILSYTMKNYVIFFLTARNDKLFNSTLNWLNSNGLKVTESFLYLVPQPKFKLCFLDIMINQSAEVIYIDDLTFGHEIGKMQLHQHLIDEVNRKNITYFGINEIDSINKKPYVG